MSNVKMKDLTDYARAIDQAKTDQAARTLAIQMTEHFTFKSKTPTFVSAIRRKSRTQIQKMAWDLVLRGEQLQVLSI